MPRIKKTNCLSDRVHSVLVFPIHPLTMISFVPPSFVKISILVAFASILFSMSSLTTDAGLSITS